MKKSLKIAVAERKYLHETRPQLVRLGQIPSIHVFQRVNADVKVRSSLETAGHCHGWKEEAVVGTSGRWLYILDEDQFYSLKNVESKTSQNTCPRVIN